MVVVPISSVSFVDWQVLVKESPVVSWFQTPEAYNFYAQVSNFKIRHSTFHFKPFGYAVTEAGRLTGLLVGFIQSDGRGLKHFASRRAIINGGPLLADDISSTALSALLSTTINNLKHKVIYIECRNFNDYARWQQPFASVGFDYHPHYNFHVALPNPIYSKELIRNLREAEQEGVQITETPSDEQFRQFYNLLLQLYHHKIHKPLPPFQFFDYLRHQPHILTCIALAPSNAHTVSLSSHLSDSPKVIGGFIGPYSMTTLYDWYSCGCAEVPRRWHPSELVTNYAIQRAEEIGCQCFDFMGAGAPDDGGYGVRDFKAKFGGDLVTHGRFLYRLHPLLYRLGHFVISHRLIH